MCPSLGSAGSFCIPTVGKGRFADDINIIIYSLPQSSYEIIAIANASAEIVWATGTVPSSQSQQVVYNGTQLISDTIYTWKVRFTDLTGALSPWSEEFIFTTGLLSPADWGEAQECRLWVHSSIYSLCSGFPALLTPPRSVVTFYAGSSCCLQTLPSLRHLPTSTDSGSCCSHLWVSSNTYLSYYKLYVNGQRVSTHELGIFTTFQERIYYDTYDVQPALWSNSSTQAIGTVSVYCL
jgi:hypothetical protein